MDNRLTFTPLFTTICHIITTNQPYTGHMTMDKKYLVRLQSRGGGAYSYDICYGDESIMMVPDKEPADMVAEALTEAHKRGANEADYNSGDIAQRIRIRMEEKNANKNAVDPGESPIMAPMGMDTPQPENYNSQPWIGVPTFPSSESSEQDDLPSMYPYGVPLEDSKHDGLLFKGHLDMAPTAPPPSPTPTDECGESLVRSNDSLRTIKELRDMGEPPPPPAPPPVRVIVEGKTLYNKRPLTEGSTRGGTGSVKNGHPYDMGSGTGMPIKILTTFQKVCVGLIAIAMVGMIIVAAAF